MIHNLPSYLIIAAFVVIISLLAMRLLILAALGLRYGFSSKKTASGKSFFGNNKKFLKTDEALLRAKLKIPKSQSEIKAELLSKKSQQDYEIINSQEEPEEEAVIVGVIQPIGKWTSLILGKKISYLIQQTGAIKGGFWTNMIKAKSRSAERERGRSL